MSGQDTELEPELASFLGRRRIQSHLPPEVRARILDRARAVVSARGGRIATPPANDDVKVRVMLGSGRRRPLVWGALAASVAVVAGTVGAVAALRAHEEAAPPSGVSQKIVAMVSTIPRAATPAAPALAQPTPEVVPTSDETTIRPRTSGHRHVSRGAPDPLGAELKLLHPAQEAYEHRDWSGALRAIGEHARAFPRGRLAEEREALRVECLLRLGRGAEARKAASAYVERFPNSVLLPRVRVAIE